ncbi:hypothetical protein ABPG74_017715 [Tetrahymena malaccensis]
MSLQFKTEDVVKLMLQFMKENGLVKSLKQLQEETQVSLNVVSNTEQFVENIKEGRWDKVLNEVQSMKLPGKKLMELYEIVVCELLELGESVAAQFIVKQAVKPAGLFEEFKERALRLDYLSKKIPIDIRELYQDKYTKEKRRANLASSLLKEVVSAPPSRLLQLLGDALKFQEQSGQLTTGIKLDLFTGQVPHTEDTEDIPINKVEKLVQFGGESRILCAEFSKNGNYLALGSADGIIEVWDSVLMKLRSDLTYQKDEQFMFHEEAIHALTFSDDGEILVSGDKVGTIKVWKTQTGKSLKKIDNGLSESISSLKFGADPSHLIVGYNKNLIRVYGLKSGTIIMEHRSKQEGNINDLIVPSIEEVISVGTDGFIRVWDSKTGQQQQQIKLPRTENQSANEVEIFNIIESRHKKGYFVCEKSNRLVILDKKTFEITSQYVNDRNEDFASGSLSAQKRLVYGVTNKGYLYCYRAKDSKIQSFFQVSQDEVLGIKHHPSRNILVAYTLGGDFLFLKAK